VTANRGTPHTGVREGTSPKSCHLPSPVTPSGDVALLLTNEALDEIARRVADLLADRQPTPAEPVGYTIRTLAAELHVSEKTIRGAIHRGELTATRRGTRYLIPADAARAWATPNPGRARRTTPASRSQQQRPLAAALDQAARSAP